MILCTLISSKECSADALAVAVELSSLAASQHHARMKEEGLLENRRDAQAVLYRVADPNLARIAALLKDNGLIVAGATGFCGLAHLLRIMPWNRRMAM